MQPTPPAGPGARRTLAGLLPLALFAAHAALYVAPFEDAFISMRYARNAAAGLGWVFNPGERVEGFTSFTWVAALAAAARLSLPLPATATVGSLAAGAALVLLTAWFARRLRPQDPEGATLAALLVAAQGSVAYYAASGMEHTLFGVTVLLGVGLALRGPPLAAAALLVLASLTRPEGIAYATLTVAALALIARRPRDAARVALPYALGFAVWFAWRWRYFGYPLPNTYYAKAAGSLPLALRGASHVLAFAWSSGLALALCAAWRGGAQERWLRAALGLIALGATAAVVKVGGDGFPFYRFFIPVIPLAAMLGVMALSELPAMRRRLAVAAVACLAFGSAWLPHLPDELSPRRRFVDLRRINDDYAAVGRWMRATLPPDATVALNAIGIVPWESGLRTLDMLGLTDAHIAHRDLPLGRGPYGHEKHDATYVIGRRPDVIVPGLPVLARRRVRLAQLDAWWRPWYQHLPGDLEMRRNPSLLRDYSLLSREVRPGRWTVLFVRNDFAPRVAPARAEAGNPGGALVSEQGLR